MEDRLNKEISGYFMDHFEIFEDFMKGLDPITERETLAACAEELDEILGKFRDFTKDPHCSCPKSVNDSNSIKFFGSRSLRADCYHILTVDSAKLFPLGKDIILEHLNNKKLPDPPDFSKLSQPDLKFFDDEVSKEENKVIKFLKRVPAIIIFGFLAFEVFRAVF